VSAADTLESSVQVQPYHPRGRTILHEIIDRHHHDFVSVHEQKYRETYGDYRFERINRVIGQFRECGDYTKGIARIRCTNPECGYDYFRAFSCKSFYLCPSCHQKRTLLFAERLTEHVLLDLPHCQFVFSIPKALRVVFKYDRRLFADVSRLIYRMILEFYTEAAGRAMSGAAILAFQTYGDVLRFNAHWHAHVLEGGFDSEGTFYYLPYRNLERMTEYFRRKRISLFLKKKLINEEFARNLLSWKHSGFEGAVRRCAAQSLMIRQNASIRSLMRVLPNTSLVRRYPCRSFAMTRCTAGSYGTRSTTGNWGRTSR
jgi:hypothetical protein